MPPTDLKTPGIHPLGNRLLLFSIGGALGGLLCAPAQIMEELIVHGLDSRMPVLEFLEFYSPLSQHFWAFVGVRAGAFAGAPIGGAIVGSLIGVFARGPRTGVQVLKVALWLASLYACVPLMMQLVPNAKAKFLIMAPVFFLHGAIFGSSTAFFAELSERAIHKIKSRGKKGTT